MRKKVTVGKGFKTERCYSCHGTGSYKCFACNGKGIVRCNCRKY